MRPDAGMYSHRPHDRMISGPDGALDRAELESTHDPAYIPAMLGISSTQRPMPSTTYRSWAPQPLCPRLAAGAVLGVSDWQLGTQEGLDGFAQVTGEEQFVHVDVECCPSATA
jgi:hypothetical protein